MTPPDPLTVASARISRAGSDYTPELRRCQVADSASHKTIRETADEEVAAATKERSVSTLPSPNKCSKNVKQLFC